MDEVGSSSQNDVDSTSAFLRELRDAHLTMNQEKQEYKEIIDNFQKQIANMTENHEFLMRCINAYKWGTLPHANLVDSDSALKSDYFAFFGLSIQPNIITQSDEATELICKKIEELNNNTFSDEIINNYFEFSATKYLTYIKNVMQFMHPKHSFDSQIIDFFRPIENTQQGENLCNTLITQYMAHILHDILAFFRDVYGESFKNNFQLINKFLYYMCVKCQKSTEIFNKYFLEFFSMLSGELSDDFHQNFLSLVIKNIVDQSPYNLCLKNYSVHINQVIPFYQNVRDLPIKTRLLSFIFNEHPFTKASNKSLHSFISKEYLLGRTQDIPPDLFQIFMHIIIKLRKTAYGFRVDGISAENDHDWKIYFNQQDNDKYEFGSLLKTKITLKHVQAEDLVNSVLLLKKEIFSKIKNATANIITFSMIVKTMNTFISMCRDTKLQVYVAEYYNRIIVSVFKLLAYACKTELTLFESAKRAKVNIVSKILENGINEIILFLTGFPPLPINFEIDLGRNLYEVFLDLIYEDSLTSKFFTIASSMLNSHGLAITPRTGMQGALKFLFERSITRQCIMDIDDFFFQCNIALTSIKLLSLATDKHTAALWMGIFTKPMVEVLVGMFILSYDTQFVARTINAIIDFALSVGVKVRFAFGKQLLERVRKDALVILIPHLVDLIYYDNSSVSIIDFIDVLIYALKTRNPTSATNASKMILGFHPDTLTEELYRALADAADIIDPKILKELVYNFPLITTLKSTKYEVGDMWDIDGLNFDPQLIFGNLLSRYDGTDETSFALLDLITSFLEIAVQRNEHGLTIPPDIYAEVITTGFYLSRATRFSTASSKAFIDHFFKHRDMMDENQNYEFLSAHFTSGDPIALQLFGCSIPEMKAVFKSKHDTMMTLFDQAFTTTCLVNPSRIFDALSMIISNEPARIPVDYLRKYLSIVIQLSSSEMINIAEKVLNILFGKANSDRRDKLREILIEIMKQQKVSVPHLVIQHLDTKDIPAKQKKRSGKANSEKVEKNDKKKIDINDPKNLTFKFNAQYPLDLRYQALIGNLAIHPNMDINPFGLFIMKDVMKSNASPEWTYKKAYLIYMISTNKIEFLLEPSRTNAIIQFLCSAFYSRSKHARRYAYMTSKHLIEHDVAKEMFRKFIDNPEQVFNFNVLQPGRIKIYRKLMKLMPESIPKEIMMKFVNVINRLNTSNISSIVNSFEGYIEIILCLSVEKYVKREDVQATLIDNNIEGIIYDLINTLYKNCVGFIPRFQKPLFKMMSAFGTRFLDYFSSEPVCSNPLICTFLYQFYISLDVRKYPPENFETVTSQTFDIRRARFLRNMWQSGDHTDYSEVALAHLAYKTLDQYLTQPYYGGMESIRLIDYTDLMLDSLNASKDIKAGIRFIETVLVPPFKNSYITQRLINIYINDVNVSEKFIQEFIINRNIDQFNIEFLLPAVKEYIFTDQKVELKFWDKILNIDQEFRIEATLCSIELFKRSGNANLISKRANEMIKENVHIFNSALLIHTVEFALLMHISGQLEEETIQDIVLYIFSDSIYLQPPYREVNMQFLKKVSITDLLKPMDERALFFVMSSLRNIESLTSLGSLLMAAPEIVQILPFDPYESMLTAIGSKPLTQELINAITYLLEASLQKPDEFCQRLVKKSYDYLKKFLGAQRKFDVDDLCFSLAKMCEMKQIPIDLMFINLIQSRKYISKALIILMTAAIKTMQESDAQSYVEQLDTAIALTVKHGNEEEIIFNLMEAAFNSPLKDRELLLAYAMQEELYHTMPLDKTPAYVPIVRALMNSKKIDAASLIRWIRKRFVEGNRLNAKSKCGIFAMLLHTITYIYQEESRHIIAEFIHYILKEENSDDITRVFIQNISLIMTSTNISPQDKKNIMSAASNIRCIKIEIPTIDAIKELLKDSNQTISDAAFCILCRIASFPYKNSAIYAADAINKFLPYKKKERVLFMHRPELIPIWENSEFESTTLIMAMPFSFLAKHLIMFAGQIKTYEQHSSIITKYLNDDSAPMFAETLVLLQRAGSNKAAGSIMHAFLSTGRELDPMLISVNLPSVPFSLMNIPVLESFDPMLPVTHPEEVYNSISEVLEKKHRNIVANYVHGGKITGALPEGLTEMLTSGSDIQIVSDLKAVIELLDKDDEDKLKNAIAESMESIMKGIKQNHDERLREISLQALVVNTAIEKYALGVNLDNYCNVINIDSVFSPMINKIYHMELPKINRSGEALFFFGPDMSNLFDYVMGRNHVGMVAVNREQLSYTFDAYRQSRLYFARFAYNLFLLHAARISFNEQTKVDYAESALILLGQLEPEIEITARIFVVLSYLARFDGIFETFGAFDCSMRWVRWATELFKIADGTKWINDSIVNVVSCAPIAAINSKGNFKRQISMAGITPDDLYSRISDIFSTISSENFITFDRDRRLSKFIFCSTQANYNDLCISDKKMSKDEIIQNSENIDIEDHLNLNDKLDHFINDLNAVAPFSICGYTIFKIYRDIQVIGQYTISFKCVTDYGTRYILILTQSRDNIQLRSRTLELFSTVFRKRVETRSLINLPTINLEQVGDSVFAAIVTDVQSLFGLAQNAGYDRSNMRFLVDKTLLSVYLYDKCQTTQSHVTAIQNFTRSTAAVMTISHVLGLKYPKAEDLLIVGNQLTLSPSGFTIDSDDPETYPRLSPNIEAAISGKSLFLEIGRSAHALMEDFEKTRAAIEVILGDKLAERPEFEDRLSSIAPPIYDLQPDVIARWGASIDSLIECAREHVKGELVYWNL